MGWSSGTRLIRAVINGMKTTIPSHNARKAAYIGIIGAFEDEDWDCQDEAMGIDPAFDAAMRELHPGWFNE